MFEMVTKQKQNPALVAAAETARALVEAKFLVALHKPRDVKDARLRILEAVRSPRMADRVEWTKKQGRRQERGKWVDNYISGPTIRFAELVLREWGNISSDVMVIYEDEDVRRTQVTLTDLETNATFTRQISVNKTVERKGYAAKGRDVLRERKTSEGNVVYICRATDEEVNQKEASIVSRVLRTEGLRLIPSGILDEAIEQARSVMQKADAEDPNASLNAIVDTFATVGIRPKDIENYLGHPLERVNAEEVASLRGIYAAIRDGEARWEDYLPEEIPAEEDKGPGETIGDVVGIPTPTAPAPKKTPPANRREAAENDRKPEPGPNAGPPAETTPPAADGPSTAESPSSPSPDLEIATSTIARNEPPADDGGLALDFQDNPVTPPPAETGDAAAPMSGNKWPTLESSQIPRRIAIKSLCSQLDCREDELAEILDDKRAGVYYTPDLSKISPEVKAKLWRNTAYWKHVVSEFRKSRGRGGSSA